MFISHGKWDTVLPLNRCSRRLVPQLQSEGYEVLYREFYGFHMIPGAIAREALNWFKAQSGI